MIKINEGSVGHWAIRAVWVAAVAAFVLYIPTKTETGTIGDVTTAFELSIAAMALNLALGFTGVISIGHSAFFGLGGYTTAILLTEYGWSPGWTLYMAFVVAFVAGCLVGLPALRLKGIYLALVTLALAVLFPQLVKWQKLAWLTGGPRGINDVSYRDLPVWPILGELRGREGRAVFSYWLAFVVLVVAYLMIRGIVKSRVGRSLIAVRDNETAAAVMGVNLAATKTIAFGVSAGICALAGSISSLRTTFVGPEVVNITLVGSIVFLLVMVLGGAATLWGPIVGGFAFMWIETRARTAGANQEGVLGTLLPFMNSSHASLVLAVALLVLMFVAPFGIVGLLKRAARRVVIIVPRPAGSAPVRPPDKVLEQAETAPSPI